ncbi:MAG TPA: hypothetical protein VFN67_08450 [Polyangiales bacterium]|nr:hypothetical protein [Polyangiales bacterium]
MRAWLGTVLCCALSACFQPHNAEGVGVEARSQAFRFSRLDKVDLLFVVDNSNSMAGEQALLRAQFPRLMETLTTGRRSPDDPRPFTPVRDLHVGVVSTDMGIPGVELPPSCHADGGDDGKLQNKLFGTSDATCESQYPVFLTYDASIDSPLQLAKDFSCVATLGTGGCGFESQLEAPFKALMPRILTDARGAVVQNPYRFLATDEIRTWGRGDLPVAQGGNAGFLRQDPKDPSLLVIVLLTDEEDCSVKSTDHLKPNNQLLENSPYRAEDINLRCHNHPEFLYEVRDRYLNGFRALRPGREDLVVFSAIVGVPVDLVSAEVMAATDLNDEDSREAFYEKILNDDRMKEVVDPTSVPGSGQGNLIPSCVRQVDGEAMPATAYPPRRIVELARAFGPNGMVQSICQDDFGPAVDMIVNSMAKPLTEMCMPQKLLRGDDDKVSCALYWELPTEEQVKEQMLDENTPTQCTDLPDVLDPRVEVRTGDNGGQRCAIQQLAVAHGRVASDGDGWYYDDFTDGLDDMCSEGLPRRIAFTERAHAPRGVAVALECEAGASEVK